MSPFAQQQSPTRQQSSSALAKPDASAAGNGPHAFENLQRAAGNQAVLRLMQPPTADASDQPPSTGSSAGRGTPLSRPESPIDAPPFHSTPRLTLQTKLTINTPGDAYEQEADRVAEHVMRMPEPQVQRTCACGGTCDDCKKKQDSPQLQMKSVSGSEPGQMEAPPSVHEVLRQPGQPLDASTRAYMEPRFGRDFGDVRVHTDLVATQSARELNARAYTVGTNIVFGSGLYQSNSSASQALLAHELGHTIQQSSSGVALQRSPGDGSGVSPKSPEPLEAIASRIANLAFGPKQDFGDFPRGEVISVVRDDLSGEIFVGLNTGIPAKLTDAMEKAIAAHNASIGRGDINVVHTIEPGGHAEVVALNQAIAARQARTNQPVTAADMNTFELHNIWMTGGDRRFSAAPRCEHCAGITSGVRVTRSLFIAENPVAPMIPPARTAAGTLSSKGAGGSGPDGGIQTAPTPTKSPTGGPITPVGKLNASAPSSPSRQPASTPGLAEAMVSMDHDLARSIELTGRVQKYIAAWAVLDQFLSYLSAIDSMEKMLAHGTAMPKEQAAADEVLKQSFEAKTEAETATEDIDLLGWGALVFGAIYKGDDAGLFQIDGTLSRLAQPLDSSAKTLQSVADGLYGQADALNGPLLEQLVGALTPNLMEGASNAIAGGLYVSLGPLQGTIRSGADNYAEAAFTLGSYAERIRQIARLANDSAWNLRQARARLQFDVDQAKRLKSWAPPAGESEDQRKMREFMDRLTGPGG